MKIRRTKLSDILIPVNPEFHVKVRKAGTDIVEDVSSHNDGLTAFKAINRLNFVHGHRTGDFYYIEEGGK
jgi:hypothetical protein